MGVDMTIPKAEQDKIVRALREQVRVASGLNFDRSWTSYNRDGKGGVSPASKALQSISFPSY